MYYFRSGAATTAASNLFKNELPKVDIPANGKSVTAVKELPLITFPFSPWTTAINLSVVGSGPIWIPG